MSDKKFEFTQNQLQICYIELDLETYRNYIQFVEDHFTSSIQKAELDYTNLKDKFKKNIENFPPEYQEHLKDQITEHIIEIDNKFLQNFRSSIIIQLFSFLEKHLIDACDKYKSMNNKEYFVKELKGNNDFDRIKVFLIRSVNIIINDLNPEWSYLDNVRKLRNCVVHHNDTIRKEDRNFSSLDQFKTNRYKLNNYNDNIYEIQLFNKDFLIEIIDNIYNLFLKLSAKDLHI